jgi:putative transposase
MMSQGIHRDKALQVTDLSKHQFYHKATSNSAGRKPSTHTFQVKDGVKLSVCNTIIINAIKELQLDPDTVYGYIKTTYALKMQGFDINKKKVYKLMQRHKLLQKAHPKGQKTYVKYRRVIPGSPLEILEMDIKMVWVEEHRKHAYILTIIDTFTRVVLYHIVRYSITQKEVKEAWDSIIINHLQPNDCLNRKLEIEVRNDNDKRFSATMVQQYFKENYLNQVFTHPYTPQENGHIESFHQILSKHLKPKIFWSLRELSEDLDIFYEKYNNERIHASIDYVAPNVFWELWKNNYVNTSCTVKSKRLVIKLTIKHSELASVWDGISGNESQREGLREKKRPKGTPLKKEKEPLKEAPS